jgi:hypothetical protein
VAIFVLLSQTNFVGSFQLSFMLSSKESMWTPLDKSFLMNEYYVSGFLHVEAIGADFNKFLP